MDESHAAFTVFRNPKVNTTLRVLPTQNSCQALFSSSLSLMSRYHFYSSLSTLEPSYTLSFGSIVLEQHQGIAEGRISRSSAPSHSIVNRFSVLFGRTATGHAGLSCFDNNNNNNDNNNNNNKSISSASTSPCSSLHSSLAKSS